MTDFCFVFLFTRSCKQTWVKNHSSSLTPFKNSSSSLSVRALLISLFKSLKDDNKFSNKKNKHTRIISFPYFNPRFEMIALYVQLRIYFVLYKSKINKLKISNAREFRTKFTKQSIFNKRI